MQEELLNALRFRRPQIRQRWEELLHVEPTTTPLGNPHALVHLLDWTLDEIDRALTHTSVRRRLGRRGLPVDCRCGRNPLLAYFAAGQQALQEALIMAQCATPDLDPLERDASLEELTLVIQDTARREIEAFCGVCQFRERDPHPSCSREMTTMRGIGGWGQIAWQTT